MKAATSPFLDDFLLPNQQINKRTKWDIQKALKTNPTTALEAYDQTPAENRWNCSLPRVKNYCPLASSVLVDPTKNMSRPPQLWIQNLINLIRSSSHSRYLGIRKETEQEKQQQQRLQRQRAARDPCGAAHECVHVRWYDRGGGAVPGFPGMQPGAACATEAER